MVGNASLINYKVELAYDGTDFYGWQVQPDVRTVQQEIEKALKMLFKEDIRVKAAGRTDRGVHAKKQVINFYAFKRWDTESLMIALDRNTPADISILSVSYADASFCARRSAKWREYVYFVWTGKRVLPFYRRYVWWIRNKSFDLSLLNKGCSFLIGEHDFRAFSKRDESSNSTIRRVYKAFFRKKGDLLWFRIRANAFLMHMVRIIVGSLLLVGSGKREPEWILDVLKSGDRKKAGPTAVAAGLFLWNIGY